MFYAMIANVVSFFAMLVPVIPRLFFPCDREKEARSIGLRRRGGAPGEI